MSRTGRSGSPCALLSPRRPTSSTGGAALRGPSDGCGRSPSSRYAVMTLSVFGDYFTPWMDQMFILGIGAMLIIGFGGIALGIMMLRNGFRPRITPILLMIFIPFMFAITEVTSLGSALLPLMWGWAVAAHAVVSREREEAGTASALSASRSG